MHVFASGQATTWELLQTCRTEAHAAIRKRLYINLLYKDAHGDNIAVITKRLPHNKAIGFP